MAERLRATTKSRTEYLEFNLPARMAVMSRDSDSVSFSLASTYEPGASPIPLGPAARKLLRPPAVWHSFRGWQNKMSRRWLNQKSTLQLAVSTWQTAFETDRR